MKIAKLVHTIIAIYAEIKETFTFVENALYAISPHDLTKWCTGLLRYSYDSETESDKFILEIVYYEGARIFGDKLTSEIEKSKLSSLISHHLQKNWGYSGTEKLIDNTFYVPITQFGTSSYVLTKTSANEWSNHITKGAHIYGKFHHLLSALS